MHTRLFAAVLGSVMLLTVARAQSDAADLESRIEYAYFTEDANALRAVIQTMRASIQKGEDRSVLRYLLGLGHYRLGALLALKDATAADAALADCTAELGEVIDREPKSAEALALQSACHAELLLLRNWQLMIHAPLSALRMDKALKADAGNPRALLIDGLRDLRRPKALGGPDKVRAMDKFRRAVAAFETQSASRNALAPDSIAPDWGHADAYLQLGRGLMAAGDTLGARNALERALIVAPEFAAARRELRRLLEP